MSRVNRARSLVVVALLAALPAAVAGAARLPDPVQALHSDLRRVGAGELRFLGRPIYQASLWTAQGRFEGYAAGEPVALSLWYQREFSRAELLRITATAWRLLGDVPPERRTAWLTELDGLWRDVAPGDNLTTLVVPGQPTRFYDAERFLGQVDDPDFGPAFLAIWLDSRSVVDELRVELLGSGSSLARR
ncbi:MAG TPA: chalcone isomerase family protein [Steroidobacteraceae bacterium]|nr:chalcone isomerase family protein [Steroidobacteraceae bacterium]